MNSINVFSHWIAVQEKICMKETENIKDCDVYQYLLITILISFLFFSCNNGKKKDSKNRDDIGYILKCPSKPKGLVVLFPMYGMTISETDFQTRIDEKFYEENSRTILHSRVG